MIHWKLFLPLIFLVSGAVTAAPPTNEVSREILMRQIASLQSDPAFAEFQRSGAQILELAGYEGGLYVRYRISDNECYGQWILDPETNRNQLILGIGSKQCENATKMRSASVNTRTALEVLQELALMKSAIKFVNYSQFIRPAVARALSVRKEGERFLVTYLAQVAMGSENCVVSLQSLPSIRKDTPEWHPHAISCKDH